MKALQSDGPTQKEVDTRAEIARREHETSVKYNSWWVDKLVTSFTVRCFKGDVAASFQHMDRIRKEVLEDIQRSPRVMQEVFATHFSNVDHHTLVTLQPSFFTTLASAFKVHTEAILGNRMHASTTAAVTVVALGGSALAVLLILGFRPRRR